MLRVLLLEDDLVSGRSIQAMLTGLGHSADWCRNGQEALERMAGEPAPDLVVTDILMPGMDGLEVIRWFRQSLPEIPIVAMTGQSNDTYLRAAVVFGAEATLSKPFSPEALREVLTRMEARRASDGLPGLARKDGGRPPARGSGS